MKEKFGVTIANYLRHASNGCVRIADTNIHRFYHELQKAALETAEIKSKERVTQTKKNRVSRLLETSKAIERVIKPLNNAVNKKSEYSDEEIALIRVIKENLEKTRDLCKSFNDKLKK